MYVLMTIEQLWCKVDCLLSCRSFFDSLIEEPDVRLKDVGIKVGEGFVQFLDSVQREVQGLLTE